MITSKSTPGQYLTHSKYSMNFIDSPYLLFGLQAIISLHHINMYLFFIISITITKDMDKGTKYLE